MAGKQHVARKRVFLSGAVIVAVIIAGIGLYLSETSIPRVKITSVNFKVNYIGNNSAYLEPALLDKYTALPTENISQAYSLNLHKSNGKWEFSLVITLGYNHSNPIFESELTKPISEKNSVIVQSIVLSTRDFSLAGDQTGSVVVPPFPYMPTCDSIVVLPFILNSNGFVGPLALTINAVSPAAVLVPDLQVNVNNAISPVSNVSLFGNFTIETYSYLSGSHVYIPGQTLAVGGILLKSNSNFTVSSVEVNTPFLISKESIGGAQKNSSDYYSITLGVNVSTPSYFYKGDLNITINVE